MVCVTRNLYPPKLLTLKSCLAQDYGLPSSSLYSHIDWWEQRSPVSLAQSNFRYFWRLHNLREHPEMIEFSTAATSQINIYFCQTPLHYMCCFRRHFLINLCRLISISFCFNVKMLLIPLCIQCRHHHCSSPSSSYYYKMLTMKVWWYLWYKNSQSHMYCSSLLYVCNLY